MLLAVAATVGLRGAGSDDEWSEALDELIADSGPLVLVLDNFEHLVHHATTSVGRWLDVAPALQVIATSRQPLTLRGELCYPIGPLPLSEAVELFRCRASAKPTDLADDKAVAEIVESVDRLPLAIELAASRTPLLSLAEISQQLLQPFRLLRSPDATRGADQDSADADKGHAVLERTIAWSWRLLDPIERSTLCQFAVFRGGFTLDAAESVVELPQESSAWLGDVLQRLLSKSLVYRDTAAANAHRSRFHLYQSIRAFAADHRAEPELMRAAMARHARHYARQGEALVADLESPSAPQCLQELVLGHANLAVAFERSTKADSELAVRLALVLAASLWRRGLPSMQIRLLDRAVVVGAETGSNLARVYFARGRAQWVQGRLDRAKWDLEHALTLAADDAQQRPCEIQAWLARVLQDLCELSAARHHFQQATRPGAIGNPVDHTMARFLCAAFEHQHGSVQLAREQYAHVRTVFERGKYEHGVAMVDVMASMADLDRGDVSRARRTLASAKQKLDPSDGRWLGFALAFMALAEHLDGQLEVAADRYAECLAHLQASQSVIQGSCVAAWAGVLAHEVGRWKLARRYYEGALAAAGRVRDAEGCAVSRFYPGFRR